MNKSGTQEYVQDLQRCIKELAAQNRELKAENSELHCEMQAMNAMPDSEYAKELEKKIEELESELSEKGDVIEISIASEPISVAEQLINATYERQKGSIEKSICAAIGNDSDTATERVYEISELKQIAEHLLVYCNHNSENCEE